MNRKIGAPCIDFIVNDILLKTALFVDVIRLLWVVFLNFNNHGLAVCEINDGWIVIICVKNEPLNP